MNGLHTRIMRHGVLFHETLLLDVSTSANNNRLIRMLGLALDKGWKVGQDYRAVTDFEYLAPCTMRPFNGEHIPHRDFSTSDGSYGCTVFRFPGSVSTAGVLRFLRDNEIRYRPEQCHHSYDCCANYYSQGMQVYHREGRTLAVVRWIRNI